MAKNKLACLLIIASITQLAMAAIASSRQNQMASILRNILSPTSANKAMEMLQIAAIGKPEIAVPKAIQQLPMRSLADLKLQPRPIIGQQIIEVPAIQEIAVPMPMAPCVSPVPEVFSVPCSQPVVPNKVYPYPYSAPCAYPAPAPIVNPFLPAASPVSAMAPPTSNMLPPVNPTQVRSHFLRKIPIPPPSL
ncbi:uncharacterized protein LOC131855377 [Achroia grisella]|uniref:uncharacterized protein LOC131855377 n=1 Tax=Achroia grisella TaxID=688607 RepID=UPI0027D31717|nr:uncharacterized protein LOC131855377 [Achroia grisella]